MADAGWTVATVKEMLETRIDAIETLARERDLRNTERFARAGSSLTREEYDARHQLLLEKVDALSARLLIVESSSKAKAAGLGTMGAILLGVFVSLGALAGLATGVVNLVRGGR